MAPPRLIPRLSPPVTRAVPVLVLLVLVLLAPPASANAGDLDRRFSRDGKVTTGFGGVANAVAVQADGKIVAVGSNDVGFALVRYTRSGRLDRSFGGDGKVTADFGAGTYALANGVAIQADGKIVAVGSAAGEVGTNDFALARFNPDGTLDATFGGDGLVTTDFDPSFGSNDTGFDVAIQDDGKIVMVGTTTNISNIADFAVARYARSGRLDRSFGGDGTVSTDFTGGNDDAWDLAIQADGKIVAVGRTFTADITSRNFGIVRYNVDGSLDATFDDDGRVTTDFDSSTDHALGVAVQEDGKIVAAGYAYVDTSFDFALARYGADGSLDPSFDSDGKVTTNFGAATFDQAWEVVVQSDGRIVAAALSGTSDYTNFDFALARYDPDGSLDPTFGTGGLVTTDFGLSQDDAAFGLALQPDGKLVASGYAPGGFALARYDGS